MTEFAFAFLDCEFGGLDPELHDITEIGVIVTDYRLAELASARVEGARAARARHAPRPPRSSGYDAERWAREGVPRPRRRSPSSPRCCPPGHTVVPAGQNVRMDVTFLERAYKACELPYPFDYHVIDLATLFYAWSLVAGETVPALSLRQAANHAGLARSGPCAHHALEDARLTLDTFRHFIGRLALRRPPEDAADPRGGASGADAPDRPSRADGACSAAASSPLLERPAVEARRGAAASQRAARLPGRKHQRGAEVDQHRRARSSSRSTLVRWRRSRWTTPRRCISASASSSCGEEASGSGCEPALKSVSPGRYSTAKASAVDRADAGAARRGARRARARRGARARRARARGSRAHQAAARREVLHHERLAPRASHQQHVRVAPAAAVQHALRRRSERVARGRRLGGRLGPLCPLTRAAEDRFARSRAREPDGPRPLSPAGRDLQRRARWRAAAACARASGGASPRRRGRPPRGPRRPSLNSRSSLARSSVVRDLARHAGPPRVTRSPACGGGPGVQLGVTRIPSRQRTASGVEQRLEARRARRDRAAHPVEVGLDRVLGLAERCRRWCGSTAGAGASGGRCGAGAASAGARSRARSGRACGARRRCGRSRPRSPAISSASLVDRLDARPRARGSGGSPCCA